MISSWVSACVHLMQHSGHCQSYSASLSCSSVFPADCFHRPLPAHVCLSPPPSLQESLLTQVQRIVKGEVSQAMKEQQAVVTSSIMQAMRSAAGTPVPTAHLDYQTQQANILQLLQQGQLNQAFQQVMFTLQVLPHGETAPLN